MEWPDQLSREGAKAAKAKKLPAVIFFITFAPFAPSREIPPVCSGIPDFPLPTRKNPLNRELPPSYSRRVSGNNWKTQFRDWGVRFNLAESIPDNK